MYAIIRAQKIKNRNDFNMSIAHHYRLVQVENSDPERKKLNYEYGTNEDCLNRFRKFYNKTDGKFKNKRINAVLGIEYLLTASPEFFKNKSHEEVKKYLKDCSDYIRKKHGDENVLLETWEFDETTPHLSIVVVPVDDKGKLNCRHFLGNKSLLRQLQDDFSAIVGSKWGLSRGKPKNETRANYKDLKTYYSELKEIKKAIEFDAIKIHGLTDFEKMRLIYDLYSENEKLSFKNNEMLSILKYIQDTGDVNVFEYKEVMEFLKRVEKNEISSEYIEKVMKFQ